MHEPIREHIARIAGNYFSTVKGATVNMWLPEVLDEAKDIWKSAYMATLNRIVTQSNSPDFISENARQHADLAVQEYMDAFYTKSEND